MAVKKSEKSGEQELTLEQTWPWILTIGGALGFFASFMLTLDKIKLLQNPNFVPECNLSPLISCGSVIKTWQASAFGFPNSFIGLGGFAVVTTLGVLLLTGLQAKQVKRWVWWGLELGTLFGVGLITWLQYQSVFVIKALCPYCMLVWSVTIPIFVYTTLYTLRAGFIPTPKSLRRPVAFLQRHHGDLLMLWFIIIIAIILNHFWYYWKTLV